MSNGSGKSETKAENDFDLAKIAEWAGGIVQPSSPMITETRATLNKVIPPESSPPPESGADTLNTEVVVLEKALAEGEQIGLFRKTTNVEPDIKNRRRIVVHALPIVHLPHTSLLKFLDQNAIEGLIRFECDFFQTQFLLAQAGLRQPLWIEGDTPTRLQLTVLKAGEKVDGYSAEGQEWIFRNIKMLQNYLHTSLQKEIQGSGVRVAATNFISCVQIYGTSNDKNDLLRGEFYKHAKERYLRFMNGSLADMTRQDIQEGMAAAEQFLQIRHNHDAVMLATVENAPDGHVIRLCFGATHLPRMVKILLERGYPLKVTELRSLSPEAMEETDLTSRIEEARTMLDASEK